LTVAEIQGMPGKKTPPPVAETEGHRIYDLVFKTSKTVEDARAYFESNRSKRLLGMFGREERIVDVRGKYAPVGCFEVTMHNVYDVGAVKSFNVYANLSSGAIYFMYFGSIGSKPALKCSYDLLKMLQLSPESLRVLSEINSCGEADAEKLSGECISILRENPYALVSLGNLGLVVSQPGLHKIFSNLSMPNFTAERYDLSKYLDVEKSFESDLPADNIQIAPRDVSAVLSGLLNAAVSFKGVFYMLYFTCKYVDELGRSRVDLMLTPDIRK
jgi:hypothetical protein